MAEIKDAAAQAEARARELEEKLEGLKQREVELQREQERVGQALLKARYEALGEEVLREYRERFGAVRSGETRRYADWSTEDIKERLAEAYKNKRYMESQYETTIRIRWIIECLAHELGERGETLDISERGEVL